MGKDSQEVDGGSRGRAIQQEEIANSLPEGLFGAFEGHLRSLGVWIRVSKAEGTRRQDWWGMEDKVT